MQAIVKTVIALALGVTVTAEGIESEEQAAMLRISAARRRKDFSSASPVRRTPRTRGQK
jgi:hypothetical protein